MANEKRLIDANAFEVVTLKDVSDEFAEGARFILEKLDAAPTVDAVEVVRCKDCKIAFANPFIADFPQLVCRKWANWHVVEPNDFCSYGERREGE